MTDIVERLRRVGNIDPRETVKDALEAADEIERLRNKLNENSQNFQIECQNVEIERLRKLIDGAAETGEIYERRLSECEDDNERLRRLNHEEARHNLSLRIEVMTMHSLLRDVRPYLKRHTNDGLASEEIPNDPSTPFGAIVARIDAALGTQADQPTVTEKKCNCDDHDARYCVNRISRTVRCGCECHR